MASGYDNDIAVEEFLKSYNVMPFNSNDNAEVGIESDSEYCLISLPAHVQLDMLNNTELSLKPNSEKNSTQISHYTCTYEEKDGSSLLPQIFLKTLPTLQNDSDETIVSSCAIKSKLTCTKAISLQAGHEEKQSFFYHPALPLPIKNIKQRYVLFGSNDKQNECFSCNQDFDENKNGKIQELNCSGIGTVGSVKKLKKKRKLHNIDNFHADASQLVGNELSFQKHRTKKNKRSSKDEIFENAFKEKKKKKKKHKQKCLDSSFATNQSLTRANGIEEIANIKKHKHVKKKKKKDKEHAMNV